MANRTGLKKVVKTVRGKKGTVKRSYWVKAQGAASKAGGFVKKHAGKIAGAAAVVGGAYLAHKYGHAAHGYLSAAHKSLKDTHALNQLSHEMGKGNHMGIGAQLKRAHSLGSVKGALSHRDSGVPGSIRSGAATLRKDTSKALGEGRAAAGAQYSSSRGESGFGRVASAYHALRAGHAVASNSFKGRRALRG